MKAGAYNASGVMALLIYPRWAGSANAGTMMRRPPRAQRPPPAIYWLRNYGPAALISALRRFSTWMMAAQPRSVIALSMPLQRVWQRWRNICVMGLRGRAWRTAANIFRGMAL